MHHEELAQRILKLKKERDAVILPHNYQIGEVQDIADYTGDSLGLSFQASKTRAEVILFCGVKFLAETAAIICPDKAVLMPDENAGCPMADMITVRQPREMKNRYPEARVVCYVNTTAAIKAESDICCTSANAVKDLDQRPQDGDRLILVFVGAGGWDTYACARRTPQAILTSCLEELIPSTLSRETEQSRDDLAPPAAVRQVFAQDG